jgi:hypothetical protein
MFDYIESVLIEAPEDMEGMAATPAANHLFDVNENALPVDKSTAEFFSPHDGKAAVPLQAREA